VLTPQQARERWRGAVAPLVTQFGDKGSVDLGAPFGEDGSVVLVTRFGAGFARLLAEVMNPATAASGSRQG
jgi:hypothetical protein